MASAKTSGPTSTATPSAKGKPQKKMPEKPFDRFELERAAGAYLRQFAPS